MQDSIHMYMYILDISRYKGDEPQELVGLRKCPQACIERVSDQHTFVHIVLGCVSAEPGTSNTTSRVDPP